MSEATDSPEKVAWELLACAQSHEPGSRLMGNVRAGDIARLCEFCLVAANEVASLEQIVCDFQAAAMIDVGGQDGPCLVEPRHVEAEVNRLRAALVEIEQLGHYPSNNAPDLIGDDDRYRKLVGRMADVAFEAIKAEETDNQ